MAEPSFDPPRGEPIALLERPVEGAEAIADGVARGYELSCRGDRVPLLRVEPSSGDCRATLLVAPLAGGLLELAGLAACLRAGVAIASIDLPLFGTRRSAKLSDTLASGFAAAARGEVLSQTSQLLWLEFTRQAVMEMRRAIDVLGEIQGSSDHPVAFAGVGIAASAGVVTCAVDARLRGAVLVGTGGGFGPPEIDPARHLSRVAPRPLLLVTLEDAADAPGIPAMPPERVAALRGAASSPIEETSRPAGDFDLLDTAWKFLSPHLVS